MSKRVRFKTIQFSMSTQFKCKFSQAVLIQLIQFSISTEFVYAELNVKIFLC